MKIVENKRRMVMLH